MALPPATEDDASSRGDPALVGRTIAGKYCIEKFLGGGSMGAVYKARQAALEKSVAVKVMHRAIAVDPQFVGRFHREARAASRLDHPNSMRVLDFGEEPDGLLYIAMEYVEGRDLFRVIHEDWPISDADIADILMQALAAIAIAHEMGVIHRDLKPENLMILRAKNDEGKDAYQVKVCDFGIAKITERDDEPVDPKRPGHKLTTQGLVVGTPEYMSPEQARGEKLDARSDVYAIGIILYQLLTGRTPFTADTVLAIILKHITEPPQLPSVHFAAVHKGLEAVTMRALAKDRAVRFQSARAMRTAIREAIEERPVQAPVETRAVTVAAQAEPRTSRTGLVLGVLVALALVAVAVLAGPRLLERPRARHGEATVGPLPRSRPVKGAPAAEPVPPPGSALVAPFNPASCVAMLGKVRGTDGLDLSLNGTNHAWTKCAQRGLKEHQPVPISAVVHVQFSDIRQFRSASCASCPPQVAACIASSTKPTVSVNSRSGEVTGEPAFDVPVTIVCD